MLLILVVELMYLTSTVIGREGSPVRYWKGDMSVDASSWENASIPFTAMLADTILDTTKKSAKLMGTGIRRRCYHEQFTDADNMKVSNHEVVFTVPNVTEFAVLKPFKNHLVTIEFNTKWHHLSSGNYSHLVKAIKENGVFKIEFETTPDSKASNGCNGTSKEYFIAPFEWCKYNLAEIPAIMTNGTCKVLFETQIEHYKKMWTKDTEKVADYNSKCIDHRIILYEEYEKNLTDLFPDPVYFRCHKKFKKNLANCTDDFTLNTIISNGKGFVTRIILGSNHGTVDVNMTINLGHWTIDFPKTFVDAFYFCNYQRTKLKFYFHMEPVVVIQNGERVWWMLIITFTLPCSVVALSVVLTILTRSFKSFDMNVWYYKNYKSEQRKQAKRFNNFQVYKKRHIEHIFEMVALRPLEVFMGNAGDDSPQDGKPDVFGEPTEEFTKEALVFDAELRT